jgi:hypothetical protein
VKENMSKTGYISVSAEHQESARQQEFNIIIRQFV